MINIKRQIMKGYDYMEKKKPNLLMDFLKHPMVTAIIGTLVGTLIGGLVTAYVTATNVEQATVELMANRLEIVEKKDTLEEAINKVNKEVDKKNADIEEKKAELEKKDQEIADLTEQLNDDSELNRLNEQINTIQTEKDQLQIDMDNLQKEKDKLQGDYDKLLAEGYETYIQDKKSNAPVLLNDIEVLKNEGIATDNSGDGTINDVTFAHYIGSGASGENYIEYKLDNKYSSFSGKAYIPKWVYEQYDSNDDKISQAAISIEVKYDNNDNYQEIAKVSGLSVDSEPVEISKSLIGATRLKIIIRGGRGNRDYGYDSIIRLGDPVLYKSES